MKIGIVTFFNCDNYGAELQAYALQKELNLLGYEAEVVDLEKERNVLESSIRVYVNAVKNRYKYYGLVEGTKRVAELIIDKAKARQSYKANADKLEVRHKTFEKFFNEYIKHSAKHYTLEELRHIDKLPYDIMIAGSDQIWNYMQTKYLDVFFLMMANRWHAKKISYAASFGVNQIPEDRVGLYRQYLNNMDAISVRETTGVDIVKACCEREASLVHDPTLLLDKKAWMDNVGLKDYLPAKKKYVVIYTLTCSHYIYKLAKTIAHKLNLDVINIKLGFNRVKGDENIIHINDAGPREFVTIFSHAAYVITDSFHGTAFSINFNIPFTALLNPSSDMNSRVLSILKITGLEDRIIYDDGKNRLPANESLDYSRVNDIINSWREKSRQFLATVLS